MAAITLLECTRCHHALAGDSAQLRCPRCTGRLFVRYDLQSLQRTTRRDDLAASPRIPDQAAAGVWRYASLLPTTVAGNAITPVTLGEGNTPLRRSRRYPGLHLKHEDTNPAGTVHARGLSVAISLAKHNGSQHLAHAGSENIAVALAAYTAAAGLAAHLVLPQTIPFAHYLEANLYSADITVVDGSDADCTRILNQRIQSQLQANASADPLWVDLAADHNPFYLEGLKTLGYELVEQLGWTYPAAILYPCSNDSDVVLLALGKAFDELEALGWVSGTRPRLYAVATAGEPVAAASSDPLHPAPHTQSGSQTIAVTAAEALASTRDWGRNEGILLSPMAAAATAAYETLLANGELLPADTVVLINPTAALKYTDNTAEAMHLHRPGRPAIKLPTSLPVGGIITPV